MHNRACTRIHRDWQTATVSLMRLAEDERTDLADLLTDLALEEWNAASLCAGWRVRDVVAHLFIYEELSAPQIVGLCLLGRFNINRVNTLALAPIRDISPALLVATANTHITPRRLIAGIGGSIALTHAMVHQQDIRRPLSRPRTIPDERIRAALGVALRSPTPGARRIRHRLRLVATDVDWSSGTGPEVSGPAEALLMCLAGRRDALNDCSGPGMAELRSRLTAD
jgi:uncharacterized protein (TIGR03083 family)